jgi:hypothetical protein
MKVSIITTTINYPDLLIQYAKDSVSISKKHDVNFIIAGDLKTPAKTKNLCENIQKKYKIECIYLNNKNQTKYLTKFNKLKKYLSWNSVQRRNVAFLKAIETGSEIIITIDDDNFLESKNFIHKHIKAFSQKNYTMISSNNAWYNVCNLLKEKNNNLFFHRGYPVSKRKLNTKISIEKVKNKKIAINAGLWLGDPDVDAVTRLSSNIVATKYKFRNNFILNKKTNSPFNSQNTAINSKIAPCYFLSSNVGRMDDIYASYVTKKICDHLDYFISFGEPIVRQHRNDHNIWRDLELEAPYHECLETFLEYLNEIKLLKSSDTFFKATLELMNKLKLKNKKNKKKNENKILNKFINSYFIWLKTLQILKIF